MVIVSEAGFEKRYDQAELFSLVGLSPLLCKSAWHFMYMEPDSDGKRCQDLRVMGVRSRHQWGGR